LNSLESKLTPEKLEETVNSAISAEKHYIAHLRNITTDILWKSIDTQQRRDLPRDLTTIIATEIIKWIQGNDSQNTTTENNSPFQSHIRFLESRLIIVSKKIHLMNAAELFEIIQINKKSGPEAAINHISPLIEVPLYPASKHHNLKMQAISLNNQKSDQKYPQKL